MGQVPKCSFSQDASSDMLHDQVIDGVFSLAVEVINKILTPEL